jgi:arylsulfatase A-like enzyme
MSRRTPLVLFAALFAVASGALAQEPAPAAPPAAPPAGTSGADAALAPAPAAWRPAADLVAGLHRAHENDPGPVLRFDDSGVYKYLDFHRRRPWTDRGWSVQQGYSTLVRDRRATLRFPAEAADCAAGCVLTLGVFSTTTENTVTPTLNGVKLAAQQIGDRWVAVGFDVPPGTLRTGENELQIAFARTSSFGGDRHGGGLRFVRFGPPGERFTKPKLAPREQTVPAAGGEHVALRRGARTSWYLLLPERARLSLSVVANPRSRATFSVAAVDAATGERHLLLPPQAAPADALTDLLVDLAPVAGRAARLDLLWTDEGIAGVTRAVVEVPVTQPPAGVATAAPGAPLAANVVVWAIDTLRADHLRVYDPQAPVPQPHLESFAQRGVAFAPSVSAGAHSLPSHASILLGQQPVTHKIYVGDDRVAPTQTLLPEYIQTAGIRTALISANGYVSDRWGFDQGWTYQTNLLREGKGGTCENVVKYAAEFLERNGDQRFFLYLVPVEPHVPYRYREGLTERFDAPGPYNGRYAKSVTGGDLGAIRAGREVSERDRARIAALYRGEVAHADECFGALLAMLEARGRGSDTAVIVLSDHGDELFDRGGVGHAHSVHQEVVDVPFVVGLPGRLLQGVVRPEGAGGIDLAPTVLALLGVPLGPDAFLQGQSLVPLLVDPTPGLPGAHVANHGVVKKGMALGRYKLIVDWEGREVLYDRGVDPKETTDALAQLPHVARLLRDVMGFWWRDERRWKGEWGNPAFPAPAYRGWLDAGWTRPAWKK